MKLRPSRKSLLRRCTSRLTVAVLLSLLSIGVLAVQEHTNFGFLGKTRAEGIEFVRKITGLKENSWIMSLLFADAAFGPAVNFKS